MEDDNFLLKKMFNILELFLKKAASLDMFEVLLFNYKMRCEIAEPSALHFVSVLLAEFIDELQALYKECEHSRYVLKQTKRPQAIKPTTENTTESKLERQDDFDKEPEFKTIICEDARSDKAIPTKKKETTSKTYRSCEICKRKFRSAVNLKHHMIRCHEKESSQPREERIRCVASENLLSEHVNNCGEVKSLDECNEILPDTTKEPAGINEQDVFCPDEMPFCCCWVCHTAYKTIEEFNVHVCMKSPAWVDNPSALVCRQLVTNLEKLESLRKYKCGVCHEEYRSPDRMAYHLSHCTSGPYICEICKEGYTYKKDLNNHKKESHRNEKSFFCEECGLAFKFSTSLHKHKINRHERNQAAFPCEICSKVFPKKILLTNHKIQTHNIERKFLCQVCGNTFSNPNSLNTHMSTHSDQRKFACTYCNKSFRQKEKLKFHILIHTGERPHLCQTCGKGFIRKSRLDDHMRRHRGEKRYECMFCGKLYAGIWDLKRHRKKFHSREYVGPSNNLNDHSVEDNADSADVLHSTNMADGNNASSSNGKNPHLPAFSERSEITQNAKCGDTPAPTSAETVMVQNITVENTNPLNSSNVGNNSKMFLQLEHVFMDSHPLLLRKPDQEDSKVLFQLNNNIVMVGDGGHLVGDAGNSAPRFIQVLMPPDNNSSANNSEAPLHVQVPVHVVQNVQSSESYELQPVNITSHSGLFFTSATGVDITNSSF